jgi:hypothetical protein
MYEAGDGNKERSQALPGACARVSRQQTLSASRPRPAHSRALCAARSRMRPRGEATAGVNTYENRCPTGGAGRRPAPALPAGWEPVPGLRRRPGHTKGREHARLASVAACSEGVRVW